MAVIDEIIRVEEDGAISFGDYIADEKRKRADFEVEGDLYSVKTHNEITRLEKNGKLMMETVPGAVVHRLRVTVNAVSFALEGTDDTRVTVELEPEQIYRAIIDGMNLGNFRSNISGKVIFSLDLDESLKPIEIIKA